MHNISFFMCTVSIGLLQLLLYVLGRSGLGCSQWKWEVLRFGRYLSTFLHYISYGGEYYFGVAYHLQSCIANFVCFLLENGKFISPLSISSFHIFICSVWLLQRNVGFYVLFIPFAPNSMAHVIHHTKTNECLRLPNRTTTNIKKSNKLYISES